MNSASSKVLNLVGGIFLGIGLLMSVIGGIVFAGHTSFNQNNPSANAIIKEIHISRGSRNTTHHVYVSYEVGNSEYYNELGYYRSGMHKGDLIEIHYLESNPNVIKTSEYVVEMIVIPMGLVFAVPGAVLIGISAKKKKRIKNLIANGIRADAVITDIQTDRTTTVNGRHPIYLTCQITNEVTGITTTYKSESTFDSLEQYIGHTVTVYANPADTSDAYVDLDSLVNDRLDYVKYEQIEYKE